MQTKINDLKTRFNVELSQVQSQTELDALYLKYLGKKGSTTLIMQELPKLSSDDKRVYGPLLNQLKKEQETQINDKFKLLAPSSTSSLTDLTIPGVVQPTGKLHPTSVIIREMNEFFQHLKERKLVQWAIAYVAAAFALLQGIDIVAQRFNWPEAVERGLIVACCVGFFVTVVLAWYHGERGAQRRRFRRAGCAASCARPIARTSLTPVGRRRR